jgi:hypothetical protein
LLNDDFRVPSALAMLAARPRGGPSEGIPTVLSASRFHYLSLTGAAANRQSLTYQSHMAIDFFATPTVSRYRNMVRLFEPMRASLIGHGLNVDQVITLLKAR